MDASKRQSMIGGAQVRASHKHRQSNAVQLSESRQRQMRLDWETADVPLYLITLDGEVLRTYKSLERARNWTRGTGRAIIYNKPAQENFERNQELGNASIVLLGMIPILVAGWLLFKLAGLI